MLRSVRGCDRGGVIWAGFCRLACSALLEQLVLKGADPREVIGILEQLTGRPALMEQKLTGQNFPLKFKNLFLVRKQSPLLKA
jgi:hypothetical protein